jgi:hypothetical protein
MSKICSNCGNVVDDGVNFCPYCKSQSFRSKNEITTPDSDMVHKIFYWNYDGNYVMSKAKVGSIIVFLVFSALAIPSGAPLAIIFFAIIFAALTYGLAYALHMLKGKPLKTKIIHNDYGLIEDLTHLFFFWQNREGEYVLSKTKIISHLIFLIFFLTSFTLSPPNLFASVLFGLFFETPAFVIGYGIHKLTNPNPQPKIKPAEPKKEIPKPKVTPKPQIEPEPQIETQPKGIIPEYMIYVNRLDELNSKFIAKDNSVRSLIAKRFEPPQLTYTRFITGVDKSKELFNKNMESAFTMINLADNYSPRIAGEIETKIGVLESIIDKLDGLSNELIVNDDLSESGDVDNLIDEMDNLIRSVKDYND